MTAEININSLATTEINDKISLMQLNTEIEPGHNPMRILEDSSDISSISEDLTDYSASSSRQNSIYRHNHCNNQKPLNVSNACIVKDEDLYDPNSIPETKDICLPNHTIGDINEISIDIGGSLAKMVYFTKDEKSNGVRLKFFKIETDRIEEFIGFIKSTLKNYHRTKNTDRDGKKVTIIATGGGAHKYYDKLSNALPNCKIQKEDEMQCLIIGLDFFITGIKNEVFYYDSQNEKYIENEQSAEDLTLDSVYPYLLVNIGSGVSMIKVTGPNEGNFERVGGSSLGGGTLWGLLSILTDCDSFDEMLEMASTGNNENVDLLVGDIYGKSYDKIGLKSNNIASSMGKVFKEVIDSEDKSRKLSREERLEKFNQNDIARSLLYAVSYNIGQIAYLQAQRYNLKKIYFAGSYIRNHFQTIRTLSFAIDFWSQGEKKAYFLNHEGYLGAMGAFLMRRNEESV